MTLILKRLRETSSTLEKERMLRGADTFDKKVFQYAYDLDRTYGLTYKYIDWSSIRQAEQMTFIILDKLACRDLSGNAAKAAVDEHAEQYGDLIKLICNKDLDCGVSSTTLNKVFGKDFVKKFCLQRAVAVPMDKIPLPSLGQIKYNGARMVIIVEKGDTCEPIITFKSRGGHTFEFPQLKEDLVHALAVNDYNDYVLEGELGFGDTRNENHTTVSGLVNSAIRGTPIRAKGLTFSAFDFLTLEDFNNQKCDAVYDNRFSSVVNIIAELNEEYGCRKGAIEIAETYTFESIFDIKLKFADLLEKGYEGLILKAPSSLYTFKKNKNWIKLKAEDTADLRCVGIHPGNDKFEGGIGSLICEGIVEGRNVKVHVSSGLSEAQRFENENLYVDKVIEVSYNEVIQDKTTGLWSLFIPKFIIVREDKS